jgi:hypothetical protein
MILTKLRKMFSLPPKTLSPDEKREYSAAADEFTSEGAPPVQPKVTPGRRARSPKTSSK